MFASDCKMNDTLCSIVICSHNRSELLMQTVNNISKNTNIPDDFELHIILNACSDDSRNRLLSFQECKQLRIFIHEESKAGKSYALNYAIANIKTGYFFFLDDDQLLKENYLEQLGEILNNNKRCKILTGYLMPAWDGSEPEWVHNPVQFRIPIRPFPEFDLGEQQKVLSDDDRLPSGGNIIVNQDVFKIVGYFNEEFGPRGHDLAGGEDHEFIKRALNKGFCIEYYPELKQWHQIEHDRMSYKYMFIKGYKRSFSALSMKNDIRFRPYMLRKVISYLMRFAFCFNSSIRMFYWVKSAAALGELSATLKARNK
ncbi:MAG TPA: glycosyltransferase [Candidatus Marinimicrobia bacterium]|nr:glycosyltransferase [Candidatus Neomarinimicrobiota bacterium]